MIRACRSVAVRAPGWRAKQDNHVRTVKSGLLDEIRLYADKLPASGRVVIRLFSATDADIEEGDKKDDTKTMQADGPRMLADHFASKLKQLKSLAIVSTIGPPAPGPHDPWGVVRKLHH